MSHQRVKFAAAAAALIAASACSNTPDDEQTSMPDAVAPPDTPTRSLPTKGGPPEDVGPREFDALLPERRDVEDQDVEQECCEVRFAVADPNELEDEEEGRLRGSLDPLDGEEGVELTYADGVWSATAVAGGPTATRSPSDPSPTSPR